MKYLRKGDCFREAWYFVVDDHSGDHLLVHGDVGCLINTGEINHASVETADGHTAIEVSWGGRHCREALPVGEYYRKRGVARCLRYARAEAIEIGLKLYHFGPWEDGVCLAPRSSPAVG
jgi:hypothetical protein